MENFDAHFEIELALQSMYEMCGNKEQARLIKSISRMVYGIIETQDMSAKEKEKWIAQFLTSERRKYKVLFEWTGCWSGETYEFDTASEAKGFIDNMVKEFKSSLDEHGQDFNIYEYESRKGDVYEIHVPEEDTYKSWTLIRNV